MTYIGAVAVIFSAFMAWSAYAAFLREESESVRVFLRALEDYREKMKCYLEPPSAWAGKYTDERLSSSGFLPSVEKGESMLTAYHRARGNFYLGERADGIIEECFSKMGEGYIDTELEVIELAIAELAKEDKEGTLDLPRRQRVAGALLGACAVGIVILVI